MTPPAHPRILVTGATGRLGALVVDELLKTTPAATIACLVRKGREDAEREAGRLSAKGVRTWFADYDDVPSLQRAMGGIDRLLLISASTLGDRVRQHRNVINAAVLNGVSLIAYTSLLHADRSPIGLAEDHRQTEALLAQSGIPFILLRNSWYTENLLMFMVPALARGELLGAAGNGQIASASRSDYAAAAVAAIMSDENKNGRVYELAGDNPYTMTDLAAEMSRQSGRKIAYHDVSEAEYEASLLADGLPPAAATLLSHSHAAIREGALFDDGGDLNRLIGRPTTPMRVSIGVAFRNR